MNITSYLPSKKIRIIILVLIILALSYVVYYFVMKSKSIEDQNFINVSLINEEKKSEYYTDTDNDGAYDWEEALWPELDPNNPDSDGDGILDGRYIKTKQAIQERERRGVDLPESDLSETEKLGRSAFTALLAIAQSGGDLAGQTEEQFSENVALYIQDLPIGDKLYTRDQLTLVEDSEKSIYAYKDRVTNLLRTYPVATSDIETIMQAVESPEDFEGKLRTLSLKYNDYLIELVATEVPYAIAGRHTELVNNISQFDGVLKNLLLEESERDELVSLAFLVQVQTIMEQTAEAILNINLFFQIIEEDFIFN